MDLTCRFCGKTVKSSRGLIAVLDFDHNATADEPNLLQKIFAYLPVHVMFISNSNSNSYAL